MERTAEAAQRMRKALEEIRDKAAVNGGEWAADVAAACLAAQLKADVESGVAFIEKAAERVI